MSGAERRLRPLGQEVVPGLVNQVAQLHKQGWGLIVVSSGSIAPGKYKLGLKELTTYKWIIFGSGQVRP